MSKGILSIIILISTSLFVKGQDNSGRDNLSVHIKSSDLQALKKMINNSRVVMLGDVTHGEGNVMEMNIEIIKFLHEEMGFNTIAFESGFYDLFKAQKVIDSGGSVTDAIQKSIFPIWTSTCEFQKLMEYIHDNKNAIDLIGFDCQLTGYYSIYESVDDLQELLDSCELGGDVDFELLQKIFISFGEDFTFPSKEISFQQFSNEMQKVEKRLLTLRNRNVKDADTWLQYIKSTQKLAEDYYKNKPSSYSKEEWKAWMNNPRDAQMANNLVFYLDKHPEEKIICWGASAHFANDFSSTNNDELIPYQPMGSYIKKRLGSKMFSIAPIPGSGTYGSFRVADTLRNLSNKSVEYELNRSDSSYYFIDLNAPEFNHPFISYALEYSPVKAEWKSVFDAFVFVKKVNPSSFVTEDKRFKSENKADINGTDSDYCKDSLVYSEKIKGYLTDEKHKPVSFCNIVLKNTTIGSISNEKGYFEINYPKELKPDSLLFSCVGYESRGVAMHNLKDTIQLNSKDQILDAITVSAKNINPVLIVKKAIENIPFNYIQKDYNAELYSRGVLTNYDTVKIDVENVAKIYDENGYDHKGNITNRRIAYKENIANEKYYSSARKAATDPFYLEHVDLVSKSPLLKKENLKKYNFKLIGTCEYEGEKVYKIAFLSKYHSYHYTNYYYIDEFTGTLYINSIDYSIVKMDAIWKYDLDKLKGISDFNPDCEFITLNVTYKKYENGKYFLNAAKYIRSQSGTNIKNGIYYDRKGSQTIYTSKIELDNIDKIPERSLIPSNSKKLVKGEHFWNSYNKPERD